MVGRVVEPGKLPIPEFPVKFGCLERKRVEPDRMAAERQAALLGLGQQPPPDPAAAQIGEGDACYDGYPELSIEDWHKRRNLWIE